MAVLFEYTVPSNTSEINITGLNLQKSDFCEFYFDGQNAPSGGSTFITVNGNNSLSNYYVQRLSANGSTVSASKTNESELNRSLTGYSNGFLMLSQTGYFTYYVNQQRQSNSGINIRDIAGTSTFTMSSITSIKLTAQSGTTIEAGTKFYLRKVEKEPLVEYTTPSSGNFNITGLNIQKGETYYGVFDFVNGSSGFSNVRFYVNNNTSDFNYYWARPRSFDTTVQGQRDNSSEFIGSSYAGTTAFLRLHLTQDGYFQLQTLNIRDYSNAANNLLNARWHVSSTFTMSNITTFDLRDSSGSIGANTTLRLYKLY